MYKFDSESFIKEMESLKGIDKDNFDYDFDIEEYENKITERDLKGDL